MPNKDKYQKSAQLKFIYFLASIIIHQTSLSVTCILVEEIDFEISHFRTFQTSTTWTLDRVTQHTIVYHSSTSTHIPNFVKIGKKFPWMDGWSDIVTQL